METVGFSVPIEVEGGFTAWPNEPTEENFIAQAEALDLQLRGEPGADYEKGHGNIQELARALVRCEKGIDGWDLFQFQLCVSGFRALATPEGMQWLIANFSEVTS